MLTGSYTSGKLGKRKGTLVLVSFVFVFLIASLAIGLRTSNAALAVSAGKGCHGGGDGELVTCTSSSSSSTTTVSTSTQSSSETTTTTTVTTSDQSGGSSDPVTPSSSACSALNGLGYQVLSAGTNVTIAFNGNSQMVFTVPAQKTFTWNWYWVPANGQDVNGMGQQITSSMWASGHGQNFSFFVANLNGQTGLVLQTDYAMSQACG